METAVRIDRCIFCTVKGEIYEIRSERVIISQCSKCLKVWTTYTGNLSVEGSLQLLPRRGHPLEGINDQYGHLKVCPECNSWYELDSDSWTLRCPEPLCGNTRPMVGISPKQRAMKKEHREFTQKLFQQARNGEKITTEDQKRLHELQSQTKALDTIEEL